MIPILTADQRIKANPKFDVNDIDSRDDITMDHMGDEIAALRTALEARLPQFNLTHEQLQVVRGAKRQMVDAMIGAGLNYGVCGAVSHLMEIMLQDLTDVVK